jgi:hypothetical protein
MKLIHNKVIDSSVLYMRKNGSKLKLKNLADKILKVKAVLFREKFNPDSMIPLKIVLPPYTSSELE